MRVSNPEQAVAYLLERYGTTNILTPRLKEFARPASLVPKYIYDSYINGDEALFQALRQAGYRDEVSYPNEPELLALDYDMRHLLGVLWYHNERIHNNNVKYNKVVHKAVLKLGVNLKSGFFAEDLYPLYQRLSNFEEYIDVANPIHLITDSPEAITNKLKSQSTWLYQPDSINIKYRTSAYGTSLLIDSNFSFYRLLKSIYNFRNHSPKLWEVTRTLLNTHNLTSLDFYNWKDLTQNTLYKSEIPTKYPNYLSTLDKRSYDTEELINKLPLDKLRTVADLPLADYYNSTEEVKSVQYVGHGITTSSVILNSNYWHNGYGIEPYLTRYVAKHQLTKHGKNHVNVLEVSKNPAYLLEVLKAYSDHNGIGFENALHKTPNILYYNRSIVGKVLEACVVRTDNGTIQGTASDYAVVDGTKIDVTTVLAYIQSTYQDTWTLNYARTKTSNILDITDENDKLLARNIQLYKNFLATDIGKAIGFRVLSITENDFNTLLKFKYVARAQNKVYMNKLYTLYQAEGLADLADHYIATIGGLPAMSPNGSYFVCKPLKSSKDKLRTTHDLQAYRVPPQVDALLKGTPVSETDYKRLQALISYHAQNTLGTAPTLLNMGDKSCSTLGIDNIYRAYKALTENKSVWCIYALARMGVTWAIQWMVTNREDFHNAGIFNLNRREVRSWLAQQAKAV